jgi:hypothetical protein
MDNMDHCRLLRLGLLPERPTLSTETLSESPVAKETSIDVNEKYIIQYVLLERGG